MHFQTLIKELGQLGTGEEQYLFLFEDIGVEEIWNDGLNWMAQQPEGSLPVKNRLLVICTSLNKPDAPCLADIHLKGFTDEEILKIFVKFCQKGEDQPEAVPTREECASLRRIVGNLPLTIMHVVKSVFPQRTQVI